LNWTVYYSCVALWFIIIAMPRTPTVLSVAPTPWGTGARAPHFYKWLDTDAWHRERRIPKKLTKVTSRKRSPKQLIVFVEPNKWRGTPKNSGYVPPLLKSIPRHCEPATSKYNPFCCIPLLHILQYI